MCLNVFVTLPSVMESYTDFCCKAAIFAPIPGDIVLGIVKVICIRDVYYFQPLLKKDGV